MRHLSSTPIDLNVLSDAVLSSGRGALVTFVGVVRDHHAGRSVIDLDYSAYEPMADAILTDLVGEAATRWAVTAAAVHRIGRLSVGDAAVAIAVAGDHRAEAFEACRFLIEEIKVRVPIWKRERYADGSEAWVDPTAPGSAHPVAGGGPG